MPRSRPRAKAPSRTGSSWFSRATHLSDETAELLDRWLASVLSTPGLTSIRDPREARRRLLEDALRATPLVDAASGRVVDVGSGGGSPGIPVAVALPERVVTLLEAQRRRCEFLRQAARDLPNVEIVWGRAEEQPTDVYGVALAKALAPPPIAAELVLPLVEPGGIGVLWIGETADVDAVRHAAEQVGGAIEGSPPGLLVLRKTGPTPPGFPRRPGMAKKRPLA